MSLIGRYKPVAKDPNTRTYKLKQNMQMNIMWEFNP
jgi:hypothetical protein